MSTSPLEGFVRTAGTTNYDAVSATVARQNALNNVLHAADEHAQVRVNWMSKAVGGGQGYIDTRAAPTASVWYKLASFGPFPLAVREVGRSYYLRVRVACASSSIHQVNLRVVISPITLSRGLASTATSPGDYVYEVSTSTTVAWVAGTSLGSEALSTMTVVDAAHASEWTQTVSTLTDVSGAGTGVEQCLVYANVVGSTANTASIPRLYGLYIAEYIGT